MIPEAHIVHKVQNRLRIKVPSMRGDKAFFVSIQEKFSKPSAGQTIVVNPDTASVLFLGHFTAKHVAEMAQKAKLFKLKTTTRRPETLLGGVKDMFRTVDKRLLKVTGGEMDIPSLVFLGLISHGIYQFARGNFTGPPWYTAFWYALGLFSKTSLMTELEEIEADSL
ncbi:MAG: HMA2 domain-containing protein [Desulfomonilaceae bacterium]